MILILVGQKGSGKTTVANFLAEKGWPTIEIGPDTSQKITNLSHSGQKNLALDGVNSHAEWQKIHAEFPDAVFTLAVLAPKKLRRERLRKDSEKNLTDAEILECERIEADNLEIGKLVLAADAYLLNSGDREALKTELFQLLHALPSSP